MSSDHGVFVAFSTGQNIANILPILELAQPGDQVLWLESETARRQDWSSGACNVLSRHGLQRIERIPVDDDPTSLQHALKDYLSPDCMGRIKLVANGGTKLQMMTLATVLDPYLNEILYNANDRCVLERYPRGARQGESTEIAPYAAHQVDLADVLACNGREILPGHERCIWPSEEPIPLPSYGHDADYTRDAHERIRQWARNFPQACKKKSFPYSQAIRCAPEEARKFEYRLREAAGLSVDRQLESKKLECVYNSAHKLDYVACESQRSLANPAEAPDVGLALEQAVSARLVHWLAVNSHVARSVQSVWCNVQVGQQGRRDTSAELDTAVLLKNGVLLHLECKSFNAILKDLNARLGELQRSSSRLAEMAICVPSYPDFDKDSWCKELKANVAQMQKWGQFRIIEFTLPDRPGHAGKTFEASLGKWLERKLPAI